MSNRASVREAALREAANTCLSHNGCQRWGGLSCYSECHRADSQAILALIHHPAPDPPSDALTPRPVGNRFVIRDNQLVKTANGEVLPVEEPLFLMRARDRLAVPSLLKYREIAVADGCNDYLMGLLDETIEAFKQFERDHPERMKQPGITRGK